MFVEGYLSNFLQSCPDLLQVGELTHLLSNGGTV